MTPPADERAPVWCRGLPLLIFAMTFVAFIPALRGEFLNWDDDAFIEQNRHLREFSIENLRWILTTSEGGHFHPLTWLSLALDYRIWGLRPLGYHLTNVVLHSANAVLFYYLILALLRRIAGDSGIGWLGLCVSAATGSLFFSVHPLRVESVAWVTERRDVLSGLFFMATLLAYLKATKAQGASYLRWYALCGLFFLLSLLSKAWAITLPFVLLVIDAWPLRRLGRRSVVEKLPLLGLAVLAATMAFLAQREAGAARSLAEYPVAHRAAQAMYGLCYYPWKTLIPTGLSPLYLSEPPLPLYSVRYLICAPVAVGITVGVVVLTKRRPWAAAAWVCYAIIVSPVLGIVQSGAQLVADRYSYLSCLPWAVLAAGGMARAFNAGKAVAAGVIGATTVLAFGALSAAYARTWRDSITLWTHAVAVDSRNYIAYVNLGYAYHQAGRLPEARSCLERSLEIHPNHRVHWGLGRVLRDSGDFRGAIREFSAAIPLATGDRAAILNDRGLCRLELGDASGALSDFQQAERERPGFLEAIVNCGTARELMGDRRSAIAEYSRALQLAPTFAPGYSSRAKARHAAKDLEGSLADFDAWLRLDPRSEEGYELRGALRQELGDWPGAVADYESALRYAPAKWLPRDTVRQALEEAKRHLGQ